MPIYVIGGFMMKVPVSLPLMGGQTESQQEIPLNRQIVCINRLAACILEIMHDPQSFHFFKLPKILFQKRH